MKKYIIGIVMMVCMGAVAMSAHAAPLGDFISRIVQEFSITPAWGQTAPLTMTGQATVYRKERFGENQTATAARGTSYAPVFDEFVYDAEKGYIYTNDHAGVALFVVDKLSPAQEINRDKVGGNAGSVMYTFDTGGYLSPRASGLSFAGDGSVWVRLREIYTSHSESLLLYSGEGNAFDTEFELAMMPLDNPVAPNYYHALGTEPGDAGSFDPHRGEFAFPMSFGDRHYALFIPYGIFSGGAVTVDISALDQTRLLELTSNQPDKGIISGNLKKALLGLCRPGTGVGVGQTYCDLPYASDKQLLSIAREGDSYVLYDFSNPVDVEVLDTFTADDPLQYTGAVTGLKSGRASATLVGDTVYAHIPGGYLNNAAIRAYPELNPTQLSQCLYDIQYGRPEACYLGQLWKHTIGTRGWQKVMDVPGNSVEISDNLLFVLGSAYDASTLYSHPGSNDQIHLVPETAIWIYDLNQGTWLLKTSVDKPDDTGSAIAQGFTEGAIMKRDGKYYVYIVFAGRSGRQGQYSYINAYEFSGGTGSAGGDQQQGTGGSDSNSPFFTTPSSFFSPNNLLRFFQRVLRF